MKKYAKLLSIFMALFIVTILALKTSFVNADPSTINIDVWYGDTQDFGQQGTPQEWLNILGNVSDPEDVASFHFKINGAPAGFLDIGPDARRLQDEGDFNIELPNQALVDGANTITITAVDSLGAETIKEVTVNYDKSAVWPMPYDVNWQTATEISDVAQVVDGEWGITADGLRPIQLGYDRGVAIGGLTNWISYDIVVPITINSLSPDVDFSSSLTTPGVGMLVRWQGHDGQQQPREGWARHGALGWYKWFDPDNGRVRFEGNVKDITTLNQVANLEIGETYNYKVRSVGVPGDSPFYGIKVWQVDLPEPDAWNVVARGNAASTNNGSVLLLAHYVDATFGNIQVQPFNSSERFDVNITKSGNGSVVLDPDPADYPNGYPYGTMLTISAVGSPGWVFNSWGGDLAGQNNPTVIMLESDINASALFVESLSGIESDDFSACELNEDLWTFINPLNDASYVMTGSQLQMNVPGDVDHNVWTDGNNAPRIMQPANDEDFELELKFDSPVTEQYQIQGVIVEQDENNFVRFDFFSDGTNTRYFAAVFVNGLLPAAKLNGVVPNAGAPTYMRVRRSNDQWVMIYSLDGNNWTTAGTFVHPLTVSSVGPFFGNVDGSAASYLTPELYQPDAVSETTAPAFTGLLDYFFNTAAPIIPEDGGSNSVNVTIEGNGNVALNPDKTEYACGETVTLTATPASSWVFAGWSGDLTGSANPAMITINGNYDITAEFLQQSESFTLNVATNGSGTVVVDPDKDYYVQGEEVTLTAQPSSGWNFTGWSGGLSGDENPATIIMTADRSVTANFAQDESKVYVPMILR